ncbi:hypothetical protein PIB30_017264 [Stylosanthes scabra]|uniref:Uncharacterized protein n=1 Tax=Stylosanthes scabra TaxID=79078 RepID=A0ABU6Q8B6_9FABA|nr:hypothetical protein [Stylosanthes scabra]
MAKLGERDDGGGGPSHELGSAKRGGGSVTRVHVAGSGKIGKRRKKRGKEEKRLRSYGLAYSYGNAAQPLGTWFPGSGGQWQRQGVAEGSAKGMRRSATFVYKFSID